MPIKVTGNKVSTHNLSQCNPKDFFGAYKGRKKTLIPERAAELVQRAGGGVPQAVLARDYGISRETVYQYPRQAKLE